MTYTDRLYILYAVQGCAITRRGIQDKQLSSIDCVQQMIGLSIQSRTSIVLRVRMCSENHERTAKWSMKTTQSTRRKAKRAAITQRQSNASATRPSQCRPIGISCDHELCPSASSGTVSHINSTMICHLFHLSVTAYRLISAYRKLKSFVADWRGQSAILITFKRCVTSCVASWVGLMI